MHLSRRACVRTSGGLQVQGEGDGGEADGLASVAAQAVPVQHMEVAVRGAHQQLLVQGLETGGGNHRVTHGTIRCPTVMAVSQ